MTSCNGCGRCCDPVVLPYTQDDARRAPLSGPGMMYPENRRWVLEDLTPIRRRDGLTLTNDYMPGGKTVVTQVATGRTEILFSHFFTCKWYNRETRACEAYDRRPPICSGYPWYDAPPDDTKTIPLECSFNADVGQPVKLILKADREHS